MFVQFLINDLIEKEQKLIKVSALIYRDIAKTINEDAQESAKLFELLEQVNQNISFP